MKTIKEGINSKGIKYYQFGRKRFKYTTEKGQTIALKRAKALETERQGNTLRGTGLADIFGDTVKEFSPEFKSVLNTVGDIEITHMQIARRPVGHERTIRGLMNFINKLSGFKATSNPDIMFHLYLIIKLKGINKAYRLEKNEQLELYPYTPDIIEEWRNLYNLPSGMTLNSLLKNTINKYGPERTFVYRATSYNCQYFSNSILIANNIPYTREDKEFIMQSVSGLVSQWGKKITNAITDLKNKLNK